MNSYSLRRLASAAAVPVVAAGLFFGPINKAYSPEKGDLKTPKKSGLENLAFFSVNPQMEELRKTMAKEDAEILGVYNEKMDLYFSDPIYKEVVQVYNSVKDVFHLPDYFTPEFFRADIFVESEDYPYAVSSAGAKGYTQITPAAAEEVGAMNFEEIAFNTWDNINVSMAYFSWVDEQLSQLYPGWSKLSDLEKLKRDAQAYNMGYGGLLRKGFGNDAKFDVKNLPAETQHYWPKIMAAWARISPRTFAYDVRKFNSPFGPDSSKIVEKYLPPKNNPILIASK